MRKSVLLYVLSLGAFFSTSSMAACPNGTYKLPMDGSFPVRVFPIPGLQNCIYMIGSNAKPNSKKIAELNLEKIKLALDCTQDENFEIKTFTDVECKAISGLNGLYHGTALTTYTGDLCCNKVNPIEPCATEEPSAP